MDVAYDIDTVDDERRVRRHAQRDVQHGPVLGDVEVRAREHGLDRAAETGMLCPLQRRCERLLRESMVRGFEVPTRSFDGPFRTTGVDVRTSRRRPTGSSP